MALFNVFKKEKEESLKEEKREKKIEKKRSF